MAARLTLIPDSIPDPPSHFSGGRPLKPKLLPASTFCPLFLTNQVAGLRCSPRRYASLPPFVSARPGIHVSSATAHRLHSCWLPQPPSARNWLSRRDGFLAFLGNRLFGRCIKSHAKAVTISCRVTTRCRNARYGARSAPMQLERVAALFCRPPTAPVKTSASWSANGTSPQVHDASGGRSATSLFVPQLAPAQRVGGNIQFGPVSPPPPVKDITVGKAVAAVISLSRYVNLLAR